jgi:hypothetical protein
MNLAVFAHLRQVPFFLPLSAVAGPAVDSISNSPSDPSLSASESLSNSNAAISAMANTHAPRPSPNSAPQEKVRRCPRVARWVPPAVLVAIAAIAAAFFWLPSFICAFIVLMFLSLHLLRSSVDVSSHADSCNQCLTIDRLCLIILFVFRARSCTSGRHCRSGRTARLHTGRTGPIQWRRPRAAHLRVV